MHKAAHFKGKDALSHIHEVRSEGMVETHGIEAPGHIGAFTDAMREVALILLLISGALFSLHLPFQSLFTLFTAISVGLILWKTGRSGWLGWTRLERLHRLINQEKYEIEHNRDQEREELIALYENKGFTGPLLQAIVDHFMNDSDRLLKVMLEEEMGLHLETSEHPLKQACGAFLGSLLSAVIFSCFLYFMPFWGPFVAAFLLLGCSALITAYSEKNRQVNALVWTLAMATLSAATTYFLLGAFS
jgi:hypothetical protein